MLLTPHAFAGAAIGASTDNLFYIITLAFMSHFILDMLPHSDWGTWHGYKDFKLESKDYILVSIDIVMVRIGQFVNLRSFGVSCIMKIIK